VKNAGIVIFSFDPRVPDSSLQVRSTVEIGMYRTVMTHPGTYQHCGRFLGVRWRSRLPRFNYLGSDSDDGYWNLSYSFCLPIPPLAPIPISHADLLSPDLFYPLISLDSVQALITSRFSKRPLRFPLSIKCPFSPIYTPVDSGISFIRFFSLSPCFLVLAVPGKVPATTVALILFRWNSLFLD